MTVERSLRRIYVKIDQLHAAFLDDIMQQHSVSRLKRKCIQMEGNDEINVYQNTSGIAVGANWS